MNRLTSIVLALFFALSTSLCAQEYRLVTAASSATFKIKNAGFWVDGGFSKVAATASFDAAGQPTALEATAEVGSLNTGIGARDNHLKSDDYFDTKLYPTIKFKAERFERNGDQLVVVGQFTLKKVTKMLKLPATLTRANGQVVVSTEFTINRRDYGVGGWNLTMSDMATLKVTLAFEAVKP